MSRPHDAAKQSVPESDPQWLPPRRTQRPLIILGAFWFACMITLLAYLALTQA